MRLESSSTGGLAVGDADSRYFRLAAANTATKYQQLYSDGADGHTWPSVDVMHIWNNAGNNWTAFKVNVTNTASGSGSKIADLQLSGVSYFSFYKTGNFGIRTAGWGEFVFTQHDTYGLGLKAPDGNWVFAAQSDGGLAALNLFAGSAGRIGFKSTTFSTGATYQNQSVGIERVSDTELKITDASANLADWKARRGSLSEYLDITEMSAPAAPAANTARLYVEDNGSGKTRLCVRFPTGAVQVLATEP